ncbi:aspartate aminotransferase family protein [Wukongibacter sp. M2B1]|uniref:aspartate aminotransferase family protein n=1 Tax=Wukongibacter sp. M2B1 TaxID=3088895 RepID=UPI003D7B2527
MNKFIGPENIIEKKKKFLFPCSHHFYKTPPQIVRGKMQYLFDCNGEKYLDFFAGVSVMNCGHCNTEILEASIDQMKNLQHTTTIYLTEPMVTLAEKLSHVLPGDINRSFFCCTGSEANEGALLLSRLYTGKKEFISLEGSLHGRTHMTMAATAIPMWRSDPYISDCFTFAPNCYSIDKSCDDAAVESLQSIERIIQSKGSDKIAALIAEPIQGNGGIITPPKWYFRKLKDLLERHGILLIVDEVQTGFARTGKMFAIENYEVLPDIITVAKALGNGMPISAFCTTDEIAASFTKPSASTLGGNPVSSATAIAVLDYIKNNGLCEKSEKLGSMLKSGLLKLHKKYSIIHDVRGTGLMLGIELLKDDGQPASEETDLVLEKLKDKGILIGKNGLGRNVLALQPPLVINETDVNFLLKELDEIIGSIC